MISDPAALLRQHSMSVTAQRLAILRAVGSAPHSTADHIATLAADDIGSISRQSVYDTLGTMVERGILRRIEPIGLVAMYEDRVGDNHHHVICRSCGAIGDVDCAVGDAPCLTASNTHGFVIDEADVSYWGLCPACAPANSKTTRAKSTHAHEQHHATSHGHKKSA